jgi:hypothetical protein
MRFQNLPKRVDFDFFEGDDFASTIRFFTKTGLSQGQLDITDWKFVAMWRPFEDSTTTVPWTVDITNAATGEVVLVVSGAKMDEMRTISSSGVWDLQVTYPPEITKTIAKGYVYLVKDVTYAEVN